MFCCSTNVKKNFPDTTAVLPAAGLGRRMSSILPKQYFTIDDKTVLEHSIYALFRQSCIRRCVVVINARDQWFNKLSISYDPRINVVIGGHTRADSVMAGLKYVKTMWVIVHDAVRPCLHYDDLSSLFKITKFSHVGGILATPVCDTIKRSYSDNSNFIHYTVNRNDLWHALTPQLFNCNLLKYCLNKALTNKINITDEAVAVEYCGYISTIVQGRTDNIKITYPSDIELARFYLSKLYKKNNEFFEEKYDAYRPWY